MKVRHLIVTAATGRILRTAVCTPDQAAGQARDGEMVLEHPDAGLRTHYVDPDTLAVEPLPESPGPWARFDGRTKSWTDPRSPHSRKVEDLERVRAARDTAMRGGLVLAGAKFDTDEVAQSRIQTTVLQALIAKADGKPFEVTWTLADDTEAVLSGTQVLALGAALQRHNDQVHRAYREAKAAVLGALE